MILYRIGLFSMKKLKESSGAALLIILSVFALLIPLVQSVWSDSQSNYQYRRFFIHQMKARSHAMAGLDLSLLRLYIFKGAEKSLPQSVKSQFVSVLDQSWRFPFEWPLKPTEDVLESEKESLELIKQMSFLKGGYLVLIEPVDGLININNLSSPIESFQSFTYLSLFELLLNEVEKREELREKYDEASLSDLVDNIVAFHRLSEEKEEQDDQLNRSFMSLEELRKVPNLEEDLYQVMKLYVTVYGSKALNINYSKKEVLEALGIDSQWVEAILSRTDPQSEFYQPFQNGEQFCQFMREQAYDFCAFLEENYGHSDMISFDSPKAFRIQSRGYYRSQTVELEALFYDLSSASLDYQKKLYLEKKRQENKESDLSKEEPENKDLKIDYSYYKSLVILYLKENQLDF